MNRFRATITGIVSEGSLHIVHFDFGGTALQMMSLELAEEIRVGAGVLLTIKSTSIALAKSFSGEVSYTNLIPALVVAVRQGRLLSSVLLNASGYRLESILTRDAAARMRLGSGEEVTLLVKASELSILEVLQ